MNTILPSFARHHRALLAALTATAGLSVGAWTGAGATAGPASENYLDFAAGGAWVTGDTANLQKVMHTQKNVWGGLEGLHYATDLDKTTSLRLDGRALAGEHDYRFDLKITREDLGFINLGYKSYRTWFDGSGGMFAPNQASFHLSNDELYIDRSDLWVALGYAAPDRIHFDFRYDFTTRRGLKDSTSWGDTTLTGGAGARAIVPTFLRINEHRHILAASAGKEGDQTSWNLAGRYETNAQDNAREIHRAPGEKADRYVTQTDGADTDLFMLHGMVERRLGETLSMSTAVAHYNIDTNLSGSRIYGLSYDPVFDPVYASRQFHDEGFTRLTGSSNMQQTFANLNLLYTPNELWSVVPSLRAEKTTWGLQGQYNETSVGAGPKFTMAQDELGSDSSKNLRSLTEAIDARYLGIADWVVDFRAERLQSYGRLAEDLIAIETGVDTLYRTTDYRQNQQKYVATANWYARPGLSFTGQYYWKGRQNAYNTTRDSTPDTLTSSDRYPAYIAKQDFETSDFNLRASWSPLLAVRLVTRYDFQESTIRTREVGLSFIDTAKTKTHIIGETATWSPLPRWYVQAGGNLVYDQMKTPATTLTGAAGGIVLNSDNNYSSASVATGYVVDDRTDVAADYTYYRADNFVDNSNRSLPYGAGVTNQVVSLTLNRRLNAQLNYTLKYSYADNHDVTSGGLNSYRAHLVYGKVQYRF